ncbi:MAG: hypothetical protein AVDCRST_MAG09-350, partial [uncultured Sphingomonas sp.]
DQPSLKQRRPPDGCTARARRNDSGRAPRRTAAGLERHRTCRPARARRRSAAAQRRAALPGSARARPAGGRRGAWPQAGGTGRRSERSRGM